ncbi:MFS transporter [Trinickia caryophylli]|uniref:MFS-type drug efflux transporter P55 n=1 Tax=Trinickia caryophylli TaxID=28094 RepID=A0A1X7CJ85_TRICW|nr:MFS transporter [Trinickia caryophylli]PMS11633.1 MFS transporter [Trinickia caryophylli]TRX19938.1 MFS transporter [Trinickia caryophylli]WQE12725.1 MFS transporter [Trinickia caryophylli]SME97405.1 Predicted arabinose efflux permease, MFS family [Trinickia caryophylli]GLU30432.1 MFS transporter [Trinickia caryophylli]
MNQLSSANASVRSSASAQAGPAQGAVLLLGSSLTIVGAVMVAPILPKIAAEFVPAHPAAAGLVPLVATGPALAIALFAPVAGWLADRLGRKMLLLLATLVYGLVGAAPALLNDLGAILVSRFLLGAAEACVMTCCTTLIGDYWQGDMRVRYVNRQIVTIGIVGTLFFVIGGAAGEHAWRYPFYLYLLPILLVPAIAALLWEPLRALPPAQADEDAAPLSGRALAHMLGVGYALICFGMICSFVVPVQMPQLMIDIGEHSSTMIGLASGIGLLSTLGGSIAWPWLRNVAGRRLVNVVLLVMLAVGLYLFAQAHSVKAILVAVVIHGFGGGMLVPNAILPLMRRLPLATRGRGLGGFTAALYFGQFVSPLVVLSCIGVWGGLRPAIVALAGAAAAVALFWLLAALRTRDDR